MRGSDYKFKTIEHSGNRVKLQIWDTAGQERFKAITTRYYRMAAGILMVYDVTDRTSFAAVENWIKSIHQHGDPSCQVVLVANKVDCAQERVVSTEEGTACAAKYGVPFFESSARTGENVQQAFLQLAAAALGSSALFADDDVRRHSPGPPVLTTTDTSVSGCLCRTGRWIPSSWVVGASSGMAEAAVLASPRISSLPCCVCHTRDSVYCHLFISLESTRQQARSLEIKRVQRRSLSSKHNLVSDHDGGEKASTRRNWQRASSRHFCMCAK